VIILRRKRFTQSLGKRFSRQEAMGQEAMGVLELGKQKLSIKP